MCEQIISAIIGLAGVVTGIVTSGFVEERRQKKEKERVLLDRKINTYVQAIQDITLLSRMKVHNDKTFRDEYEKDMAEEIKLYNEFHPYFSIIAPRKKAEEYNKLRNEVLYTDISQEDAYKKCIEILDFNVNDK